MSAEEAPNVDLITLTRHVLSDQYRLGASATGDLTLLLTAIQVTSKFIATNVRKARLINLVGLAGETNVQGEEQKKLDVLSNDIMVNALRASGKTAVLVSEELEDAIIIEERNRGAYCVVFDPLDGSSNIDAGVNIGTIFGIYKVQPGSKGTIEDVLRPGSEMVAAGYTMYGSSANLVLSTGQGVNGYTLDAALGEFILTHPNIQIPSRGKIYSFNEGNSMYFHAPMNAYLKSIKYPTPPKTPYSARYIGSMVADVHRTLLYGGIFGYPNDKKSKSGKLRLLYEAFPMAFLTEQTLNNDRIWSFLLKASQMTDSTVSKPRISLKPPVRPNDHYSNPQSATPEPASTRRRSAKRLQVVSDEDDDEQGQSQAHSNTLSSPQATSARRGRSSSHTVEEDSDFEAEHDLASPVPGLSPHSPTSSSSRRKRPKGKKGHDGPPTKKKRVQQDISSDEECHEALGLMNDEEATLHTKRQPKPSAKAKANKGKGKSFTTGARDERKARQSQPSTHLTSTKRRREASKPEDDDTVDVVGDKDARSNTRSPSPSLLKETAPPPQKRRKYPTITKNKTAATSEPASKAGSATGVKSTTQLPDLLKPTVPGTRVPPLMIGTSDFDLRDARVYNDLFAKPGGNSSGQALQKKNEERQKEITKMRDEARAKRMSEMANFFDLQAQFEKIRQFEETLGNRCMYPNILAVKWRDIWEFDKRKAMMEQTRPDEGPWKESGQREEGELRVHSGK
ncbi:hypothetical protein H0H87_000021 [Tephrocybe sp. NHM501043]|nr:hypothetical protein H0H87_000021 [Tephrocybe sp. NHM501043]